MLIIFPTNLNIKSLFKQEHQYLQYSCQKNSGWKTEKVNWYTWTTTGYRLWEKIETCSDKRYQMKWYTKSTKENAWLVWLRVYQQRRRAAEYSTGNANGAIILWVNLQQKSCSYQYNKKEINHENKRKGFYPCSWHWSLFAVWSPSPLLRPPPGPPCPPPATVRWSLPVRFLFTEIPVWRPLAPPTPPEATAHTFPRTTKSTFSKSPKAILSFHIRQATEEELASWRLPRSLAWRLPPK